MARWAGRCAAAAVGLIAAVAWSGFAFAHVEVEADPDVAGSTNAIVTFSAEAENPSAGIVSVRIVLPVAPFAKASGDPLPDTWFATLDGLVHAALAQGLTVILDDHDYWICARNADDCRTRVLAFWTQAAEHFKDAPAQVVFEIVNEPNGAMDARWNALLAEALALIRRTNPTRNVIVGPAFWNNVAWLDRLELPASDRHIIVTVHYYANEFHAPGCALDAGIREQHRCQLGHAPGIRRHRQGLRRRPGLGSQERPADLVGRIRCLRQGSDGVPREIHRRGGARRRKARLGLGLLAIRQRLHRVRHRPGSVGRADPPGTDTRAGAAA